MSHHSISGRCHRGLHKDCTMEGCADFCHVREAPTVALHEVRSGVAVLPPKPGRLWVAGASVKDRLARLQRVRAQRRADRDAARQRRDLAARRQAQKLLQDTAARTGITRKR